MPKPTLDALWKITKAAENADKQFFVEGYASYGDPDSEGDEISPAAMEQLAEMLKTGGADGAGVVLLHNHDPDQEIGRVVDTKFEKDENRVWVQAFVTNDEIKQKIRDTVINAFSIHAMPNEYRIVDSSTERRWIIEGWERAVELTLTAMPMNNQAVITDWFEKGFKIAVKAFRVATMKHTADEAAAAAVSQAQEENMKDMLKGIVERLDRIEAAQKTMVEVPVVEPVVEPAPAVVPEPAAVVTKAIDPTEESDYLKAQADALDGIEIADEAIKALVATISAGLRSRADEFVVEKAIEPVVEPVAVEPVVDPAIKALQDELDAEKLKTVALEADKVKIADDLVAAKVKIAQVSQQEPVGGTTVPVAPAKKKPFRLDAISGPESVEA